VPPALPLVALVVSFMVLTHGVILGLTPSHNVTTAAANVPTTTTTTATTTAIIVRPAGKQGRAATMAGCGCATSFVGISIIHW
jgi:hypothetical protein